MRFKRTCQAPSSRRWACSTRDTRAVCAGQISRQLFIKLRYTPQILGMQKALNRTDVIWVSPWQWCYRALPVDVATRHAASSECTLGGHCRIACSPHRRLAIRRARDANHLQMVDQPCSACGADAVAATNTSTDSRSSWCAVVPLRRFRLTVLHERKSYCHRDPGHESRFRPRPAP